MKTFEPGLQSDGNGRSRSEDSDSTALFDVPNLDGLSVDADDYFQASEVFHALSVYCQNKKISMSFRKHGNICKSEEIEKRNEKIYESLPDWAKW